MFSVGHQQRTKANTHARARANQHPTKEKETGYRQKINRLRIKGAQLAVTQTLSEGGRDGGGGGARVKGAGSGYK